MKRGEGRCPGCPRRKTIWPDCGSNSDYECDLILGPYTCATGPEPLETESEREFAAVIFYRHRFTPGCREYVYVDRVLDAVCFSGALRDRFPPGTENLEKAWTDLLAKYRRMVA
jgi:hypothetical protein